MKITPTQFKKSCSHATEHASIMGKFIGWSKLKTSTFWQIMCVVYYGIFLIESKKKNTKYSTKHITCSVSYKPEVSITWHACQLRFCFSLRNNHFQGNSFLWHIWNNLRWICPVFCVWPVYSIWALLKWVSN